MTPGRDETDPTDLAAQAQALLEASRSAEGGSPWVTAYDGDYYVHNGYSRIATATFSEEVADLIAAAPDLAIAVVRLAAALAAAEARVEPVEKIAREANAAAIEHRNRADAAEAALAAAEERADRLDSAIMVMAVASQNNETRMHWAEADRDHHVAEAAAARAVACDVGARLGWEAAQAYARNGDFPNWWEGEIDNPYRAALAGEGRPCTCIDGDVPGEDDRSCPVHGERAAG